MKMFLGFLITILLANTGLAQSDTSLGKWYCFEAKTNRESLPLAAFFLADTLHHLRDNQHYPTYLLRFRSSQAETVYASFSYTNTGIWRQTNGAVLSHDQNGAPKELDFNGRTYELLKPGVAGSLKGGQPCFTYKSKALRKEEVMVQPIFQLAASQP